jgi:hypothetical protein
VAPNKSLVSRKRGKTQEAQNSSEYLHFLCFQNILLCIFYTIRHACLKPHDMFFLFSEYEGLWEYKLMFLSIIFVISFLLFHLFCFLLLFSISSFNSFDYKKNRQLCKVTIEIIISARTRMKNCLLPSKIFNFFLNI